MFEGPFSSSILKRAVDKNLLEINYINIRDFGIGKHALVDDTPYGGGAGMLLRVDVLDTAIQAAKCATSSCKERIILLDAGGEVFTQKKAQAYTSFDHLILICAHYEGIDFRIRDFIDEELSIGDYILTGGEIPAMIVTDAVSRLLPNVLGNSHSAQFESFQKGLLEQPQYTKPHLYKGKKVPDILLSGHHKEISLFQEKQSQERTLINRPDLIKKSA